MKQSAYFTIEQIYTQLVVRLVYKSTNIIDRSSGLLHFGASILILKTAWEPSCTQYFIQPRNVNKHLYLVVSHYLLFLSLPAAILHLQPVQENIGLHCAESPLLSKRGQPQQKCVRSPAHPQQQVHDGGEECLKVLFFSPLTPPPTLPWLWVVFTVAFLKSLSCFISALNQSTLKVFLALITKKRFPFQQIHSNQVKTKQLVTGESRKGISVWVLQLFSIMMTPHCDEVYIVNFKIYPLLYWSLSSRPQWPPAKMRHHQPIALSYWSESFNWGRLPSCVLMFALRAKYRLTSNEIFQLLGPAGVILTKQQHIWVSISSAQPH